MNNSVLEVPNAEELKAFRQSHGLTQAQIAALCHMKTRTYERYEQGRSPIPLVYWELLLLKLDKKQENV